MEILCACGCGQKREKYDNCGNRRIFIHGHNRRNKPMSEETKLKMSEIAKRKGYRPIVSPEKRKEMVKKISIANRGRKASEETKKKISLNHWRVYGENHPSWRGGRKKSGTGYISVYSPDHPFAHRKYVTEHRLVMENI